MKIRTRLLLFLLPTLIGSVILTSLLLSYGWYQDPHPTTDRLILILLGAAFTLLVMILTLFMIANKISRPIQKLNNSALALAAGQYGAVIPSDGPKEIEELSNTLNIMSECLHENINRLKENALLRERSYGEYECAMMLQHLMLQKNIDECRTETVAIKNITLFSDNPRGILLDFPKNKGEQFAILLTEAEEAGFEGMYQLLQSKKGKPPTTMILDPGAKTLSSQGPIHPFLFSMKKRNFAPPSGNRFSLTSEPIEPGDFFFLYNEGLLHLYKHVYEIENLLSKVLNVFAQDGLDTVMKMVQKEISFLLKKKPMKEDIHLISFQILDL